MSWCGIGIHGISIIWYWYVDMYCIVLYYISTISNINGDKNN